MRQTGFVKSMGCHQGGTIRRLRRRKPVTTTAVVVETVQTKSTKSAHSSEGVLAQKVKSVSGFTQKANKESPGK